MQTFAVHPFEAPPNAQAIRRDVRGFLAANQPTDDPVCRANSWLSLDPDFSRKLAAAGYVGMLWPKEYGGHERDPLERYIVLEELLAAGAPVGAHWIADRQTGPLILRYGTEEQRRKYLPGMARGELYACIGLSEPNSGSDLASVRTNARRTDDGWLINGQKVWTSGAHVSHVMLALVRSEAGSERQQGLSQFLIDLDTPGITIRPIVDMFGTHHFNEVFFEDVLVPHGALIGAEGEGWKQATAELALERSGPERYLSSHALLVELIETAGTDASPEVVATIGKLVSDLWTLRQMSMSVAAKLAAGHDPMVEASIVKDLGNTFEQELPVAVQAVVDVQLTDESVLARLLSMLLAVSPSFSLRGGTREILRGIIARGLGLR
ncbi:acyl-CoA dehydrogenase family protein [Altererythrobacter arenosus]|uniref:Acyl-CoA dehydrogenase family protein n=1 Tax=Altererythrobacter arenosus TaxID=3032592 RepID=A0ABY8FQM7_9SPHN|nr:acyl-CoA dehydrogenase family protein [Altererythrobacter sp. CAU 1644]WFL77318.1 acyl-CoA dehydrogenase family protein [Altererythrobacter sp. CAU 1644]